MKDTESPEESQPARTVKRGRPKWEPPDLKTVEKLASRGLTQAQIASSLGISPDTLIARKKDFPGFFEAIKKGQARGLWDITNGLFQAACEGNITACIFYLKNRDPDNWNDRRDFTGRSDSGPKSEITSDE